MARYALLEPGNIVRAVAEWDGETEWEPEGVEKVPLPDDIVQIRPGDIYDPATHTLTARAETPADATQRIAQSLQARVDGAVAELGTIITQADTFQGQADYTVANLATINDLLHKTQAMAGAVEILARDVRALARLTARRLESADEP